MVIIVVFAVLGFFLGEFATKHDNMVPGCLVWILSVVIGLVLSLVIGISISVKEVTTQTIEIQSFQIGLDSYAIEQTEIEGKMYYRGVLEADGSNRSIYMPFVDSKVIQDLGQQNGYVMETTTSNHMPQKWMGLFFINIGYIGNLKQYEIHLSRGGGTLYS